MQKVKEFGKRTNGSIPGPMTSILVCATAHKVKNTNNKSAYFEAVLALICVGAGFLCSLLAGRCSFGLF